MLLVMETSRSGDGPANTFLRLDDDDDVSATDVVAKGDEGDPAVADGSDGWGGGRVGGGERRDCAEAATIAASSLKFKLSLTKSDKLLAAKTKNRQKY